LLILIVGYIVVGDVVRLGIGGLGFVVLVWCCSIGCCVIVSINLCVSVIILLMVVLGVLICCNLVYYYFAYCCCVLLLCACCILLCCIVGELYYSYLIFVLG